VKFLIDNQLPAALAPIPAAKGSNCRKNFLFKKFNHNISSLIESINNGVVVTELL
jgi:hypothetical protein